MSELWVLQPGVRKVPLRKHLIDRKGLETSSLVPSSASIQKSIIPGLDKAGATLTHVACGGTRRYRSLVITPEIPQFSGPKMCEAPARTPTLFLETCVGRQDIFS